MDGRNRVQDNIFFERQWWTLKYRFLYLLSLKNGTDLLACLGNWFELYNRDRTHQSLGGLNTG